MNGNSGQIVFKIATLKAWADALAQGSYLGSEDDARDGYIHLSARNQLAGTAKKYFANVEGLALIAISVQGLDQDLRWELSRGGELFPHYYGALPVSAATWVRPLPLNSSGTPCIEEALNGEQ